jgi:hypothetical protein
MKVCKMIELTFINDLIEEQIIKGRLRWLANFNEIRKSYPIEDLTFPIYASGGLQEKGFLLSRIYSAMVTPRYKVHLLVYSAPEITREFLSKIVIALKRKFPSPDWVFLILVQGQPVNNSLKASIEDIDDKNLGVAAYGLGAKDTITSNNVLGRGLGKQLKPNEAKYENFDVPNYLKSFTATFVLGILLLVFLGLSGYTTAIQPVTILSMLVLAIIVGYAIYRSRYKMSVTIDSKGFKLREGNKITERKWSSFSGVSVFISPNLEVFLRLQSKDEKFDLPVSRTGLPRRETYSMVRQIIKGRQAATQ